MNNSHFSQSGIRTFLKIFIILGLCTTALIGLSASDRAVQMDALNSSVLSTVILAQASAVEELKKQASKRFKTVTEDEVDEEDAEMDVAEPNEPEESRAAYMKLGDIKGEATDAASDPDVAGNSQDSKHKKWIDVLSTSDSSSKGEETKAVVEREMKESSEKGGTTDMNIGVGELKKATSDSSSRKMLLRKKPGRTTYKGTTDDLKLTVPPIGYVCEGGGTGDECFCDGVLDCNKLWTSGDCKKDSEWQDGNDSSKGGCMAED